MALLILGLLFCLSSQISAGDMYDNSFPEFYNSVFTDTLDLRLLQELSNQNKNVLISPISLKIILALLYQGSTGQAEREFQKILGNATKQYVKNNYNEVIAALYNTDRTGYLLNIGTSMFVDEDLYVLPKFNDTAKKSFRTDIIKTNFNKPDKASKEINSWVEKLTHGKVNKIVNSDDLSQALMLITNVIYFKGTWTHQFPENKTSRGVFYTSAENVRDGQNSKLVDYMTTTNKFLYYEDSNLDAKIVKLEYQGSAYAMFIVLPNSLRGLDSLIKNVNLATIGNIKIHMSETDVEVTLPKFKFNFNIKLRKILQKLGLHKAFQDTASFTDIVQTNKTLTKTLYITDIIQKSGIEVDEKGSEVYTATGVTIGNKMGENTIKFNVSHPFMFFIDGPNGTLLFVGKCEDPNEADPLDIPNRWSQEEEKKEPSNSDYPGRATTYSASNGNYPGRATTYSAPPSNTNTGRLNNEQSYQDNQSKQNTQMYQYHQDHQSKPNSQKDQFNNEQSYQDHPSKPNSQKGQFFNGQIHRNDPSKPNTEMNQPSYEQGQNLNPNLDPGHYQTQDVGMDDIAYRFNLFDIELLTSFSDLPTNVLISPASIRTTLAMILEGSDGTCAEELTEALRIKDINQKDVRKIFLELSNNLNVRSPNTVLESHNGVFVSNRCQLFDDYRNIIKHYYKADIANLDFSNQQNAANIINEWISTSTYNEITDVVSQQSIDPNSYVVLSNALFFKAKWRVPFDKAINQCFKTPKGCIPVDMMHISHNFKYSYNTHLRANVVDIPYQEKFSMLLIVPGSDSNVGRVIRELQHMELSTILKNLIESEIVLELPRFNFEYSVDLVEFLKKPPFKIREIFGANANLTKMIYGKQGMISNLLHKTKITVDESGTTAAASSNGMLIPLMQPATVSADRPFIFIIYHNENQNIIFEGIVQNPREK
ncbi:uncharacterized protein [Diabrotica undecimpunctata]|uniref:uncharacterized protein n=1 Tax=Diabrotica undecimpunctata TaxID=50387 RepID=UPI003B63E05D